jgi:hypothetical protein
MDKGMDTGDMLHKLSIPIEDNDTSETLFNKLMPLGASALKATLIKLRDGKAVRIKQNEEEATYAPMILKADAIIDWSDSADNIINKIRGMNPAPVAATYYNGKKVKIYEAKRNISKWCEKIDINDDELGYTHTLTNKLEMSIVSINGNDDREFISNYVNNMNVRDSLSIRKYISENEPGLDYAVTVERPESLGGGSMSVFLSLDEYVFLNIA